MQEDKNKASQHKTRQHYIIKPMQYNTITHARQYRTVQYKTIQYNKNNIRQHRARHYNTRQTRNTTQRNTRQDAQ